MERLTTRQIKDLIKYAKDLGAEDLEVTATGFKVRFAPPAPAQELPTDDDITRRHQVRFAASG